MRNSLFLAIAMALPLSAMAASDPSCLVSFSSAQQDVCTGAVTTKNAELDALSSIEAFQDSSLRLVKFAGPISEQQRAAVEAAGATIVGYAPHYAYIVRMSPQLDASMRQLKGVIWSGPFLPA